MQNAQLLKEAVTASSNHYLPFEQLLAAKQRYIQELQTRQEQEGLDFSAQIRQEQASYLGLLKKIYAKLTPWQVVQVARHPDRPLAADYIRMIVKDFCELHGDRHFADDRAMICGFGRIGASKVMIIAHNKGRDTQEKVACNFGCAHPEGYRKALLKMKLAVKFGLPIVTLIDTPGAYPGIGAEERGQAQAIAVNLLEMSRLRTPIISVVIGEGGSGGALGIGVADRLAVMEYAYYSVISPEGCAAILWRSGEQAEQAAQALRLTSRDLKRMGIADAIIPEPLGGAHRNPSQAAMNLENYLRKTLRDLKRCKLDSLLAARYKRWRNIGELNNNGTASRRNGRCNSNGKSAAGNGKSSRGRNGR